LTAGAIASNQAATCGAATRGKARSVDVGARLRGEMASRPDGRIVISWDIVLSEFESCDYCACVVLLIRKEIAYIFEVVRGRFPWIQSFLF
jgi:phage terminase large subunit-like protein